MEIDFELESELSGRLNQKSGEREYARALRRPVVTVLQPRECALGDQGVVGLRSEQPLARRSEASKHRPE